MLRALARIFVSVSVFFFVLSLTSLAVSGVEKQKKDETFKELDLFADALAYIQAQYVEETKPKDLVYGAMSGMIFSLDSHSQFLAPEEYQGLKIETEGEFGGIGIEITMRDQLPTIITAVEGSPAWDAGLESYDRLLKVDDTVLKGLSLDEVVKKIRGQSGTEVVIVVWREKDEKPHTFRIKRSIIKMTDIRKVQILEDHIAYVKIAEFRENTPKELDRALEDLKKKGMESLVLDVRNNPGGLLDKAIEVAERFLPKGTLIVSLRGRNEAQNVDFKATLNDVYADMPIVLLVNEGSASGSEILAGAFQDQKRAVILGVKTFGKGSVQTVFPLKDGSAVKLTTSRYFTPLGKTIHEKGVEPDIVVEQVWNAEKEMKQEEDLEKIFKTVEEDASEQKEINLGDLYARDAQLSRAVDLLKSMKVYKNIFPKS
ncbi:MAG: S41 family peptidase [Candidatus Omnitrophota bacterium]